MKKKLTIGDYVSVIDDKISGKIIKINSFRATIEDEFGFELEYPIQKLVIQTNFNIYDISPIEKHIEFIETKRPERVETIDLHIESLKIRHDELNIPKLEFQINAFHEAINEAKKNNIDSLIVIHGKGSGTLKTVLNHELKKYTNLTFTPINEGSMKNAAFKINFNTFKN